MLYQIAMNVIFKEFVRPYMMWLNKAEAAM